MRVYLMLLLSVLLFSCNKDECHKESIFDSETTFLVGKWNLDYIRVYKYKTNGGILFDSLNYGYQDRIKLNFKEKGGLTITIDNKITENECLNIEVRDIDYIPTWGETNYKVIFNTLDNKFKSINTNKVSNSKHLKCIFKGFELPYRGIGDENDFTSYTYCFSKTD